jgi:peptide chain release factor subunit 1
MGISRAELDGLMRRDSGPDGRVLSVYLDCDQSRQSNLNRGFVTALQQKCRAMAPTIADERLRAKFVADAQCVIAAAEKYVPRGRTLALFCDTNSDFQFSCELAVPADRNELRWERMCYVRPLVELFDEYERYGVVLLDKRDARLFTVSLGEIEENREVFSPERRKRPNQEGRDNMKGHSLLQQRDDEMTQLHMKEVAAEIERMLSEKSFDRLLLGGQHQLAKGLEAKLPKRVQERVAGFIPLPVSASEREVLAATMKMHEEAERREEVAAVDHLITAAAKVNQASLGLQPTLDAMRLGSIMRLVYVQNYSQPGKQCVKCESLFPDSLDSCSFCGGGVRNVDDVVSALVDRVVNSGGEAESVRGEAADRLRGNGQIGAFLRFQT